jgi:hypothetical protein
LEETTQPVQVELLLQVILEAQVAEGLSLGNLLQRMEEEQVIPLQHHLHKVILAAVQLHKEFQIKVQAAVAVAMADLERVRVQEPEEQAEPEHLLIYQEQLLFTQAAEAEDQWVPDLLQEMLTQVVGAAETADLTAQVQLKLPMV